MGHRPASLNPLAEQKTPLRCQTSVTVHEKPPFEVRLLGSSTLPPEASYVVDPVSKVRGHYN